MAKFPNYENMRAGRLYHMPDPYLIGLQVEAQRKLEAFNVTPLGEFERRRVMLGEMLGTAGVGMVVSPVSWEYGKHIHLGDRVFINFDCVFLDGGDIRIGTHTAIGPRVQFLTAGHPVDSTERGWYNPDTGKRQGIFCINKPITVGENCWIGAGAIIIGGVTIGDGTTIGAGSVVTRDVPSGVIAAGNPCRVLRPATARSPQGTAVT